MNIAKLLAQRQEAHEQQMHQQRAQAPASSIGNSRALSAQQKMWAQMAEMPQLATMTVEGANTVPQAMRVPQVQFSNARVPDQPAPIPTGRLPPPPEKGSDAGTGPMFTGKVKWYNPDKEIGMIESRDVRHFTCGEVVLLKSNLKGVIPQIGDACTFQVSKTRCGWKAVEMQWINAAGASERALQIERAQAQVYQGKILQFDEYKGFGFIGSEELRPLFQKDIFFMKTSLKTKNHPGQYHQYREGIDVFFRWKQDDNKKGPYATHVSLNRSDLDDTESMVQHNIPPGLLQTPGMIPGSDLGGSVVPPRDKSAASAASGEPDQKRRRRSGWDQKDDLGLQPEPSQSSHSNDAVVL